MKIRWVPIVTVLVVVAAIIGYKHTHRVASDSVPGPFTPEVVLIADLGEAGDSCGCGEIIRAVRDAQKQGLRVREVPAGEDVRLEAQYHIGVTPAVLFLDSKGAVFERHEGEDADTVEAIRAGLTRLVESAR